MTDWKSAGNCHYCSQAVYTSSNPMTCNAGFDQNPYGPEGVGTLYHMTCRRRHIDEQRAAETKTGSLPLLLITLAFMLLLLVASMVLNVILFLD